MTYDTSNPLRPGLDISNILFIRMMAHHDGNRDVFGPSLVKLGRSLLLPGGSTTASERTTCIVTLLRVLDNILTDATTDGEAKKNARLRKIKVAGPFHKRAGKYDGCVDFLVACGFAPSSEQLRLIDQDEDPRKLLSGRCELVKFAVEVLGLPESHWPDCPYKFSSASASASASGTDEARGGQHEEKNNNGESGTEPPIMRVEEDEGRKQKKQEGGLDCSSSKLHQRHDQHPGSKKSASSSSSSSSAATDTPNETVAPSPVPLSNKDALLTISNASSTTATTAASTLKQDQPSSFSSSKDEKKVEEMTDDLLDEIEMELNDQKSFFVDDNEGERNHMERFPDTKAASNHPKNPIDSLCDHQNDNIAEEVMSVVQQRENSAYSSNGTSAEIRLEQSNKRVANDEDKKDSINVHSKDDGGVMMDSQHSYKSTSSVRSDLHGTATEEGELSPMQLPQMVEEILKTHPSAENDTIPPTSLSPGKRNGSDSYGRVCDNFSVTSGKAESVVGLHGHADTSTQDVLDELESENENIMKNTYYAKCKQQRKQYHHGEMMEGGSTIMNTGLYTTTASKKCDDSKSNCDEYISNDCRGESISASPSSLLSTPPPDVIIDHVDKHDLYPQLFNDIPLPDGEFSLSGDDDDNEDVRKYREGLKLCHRLLFSLWSEDVAVGRDGVNHCKGAELSLSSHVIDLTVGLTNINRYRQIWEEDNVGETSNDGSSPEKPMILVPLDIAYTAWACILRLNEDNNLNDVNNRESNSEGAAAAAAAGKMYSWVVSNHRHLSKFDDAPLIDKWISSNHLALPEASVAVCNYVCKSLRDIGLISIYSADTAVGGMSKSAEYFVGINDENLFQEGMPRRREDVIPALLLDDGALLRECHGILSQLVCSRLHEVLEPANDTDTLLTCDWVSWYSCQHALKHLMASGRLEDATFALSDTRFIRLRLQILGLRGGTAAHCRDCSRLDLLLSQSLDEWRTKQLRSADVKRDPSASSINDHGNQESTLASTTRAPDNEGWNEHRFKILSSISTVLREKAGELSAADYSQRHVRNESTRRNLQKDIGNALQMIGECIGDIGEYRVQELEHYEEALALMTEAYGADQNHESIADILVSSSFLISV